MLKFTILNDNSTSELVKQLSPDGLCSETQDVISSFLPLVDEGCEVGFARVGKTLLVRIFDNGEYLFIYPIALCDGADEREALSLLREYAIREEIPLVFCDVPEEAEATLEEAFRFTEMRDDDGCRYALVKSELSMLCEPPSACDGVISLTPLCEADIRAYAEISKNEELNKYWGYDYRQDNPDPDDEYFYNAAIQGLKDGTGISLGVRYNGELVGEGCFWGFDLLGSAEIGFRILPKWQRRGLGRRTLKLLMEIGEEMGLISLCASVKKENIPSVGLLDSMMPRLSEESGVYRYIHKY